MTHKFGHGNCWADEGGWGEGGWGSGGDESVARGSGQLHVS